MTERQTQSNHSYGLEPLPTLIADSTDPVFSFINTIEVDSPAAEFYGYDPKTVLATQAAIEREDSPYTADEERAIKHRDQLIRAAAEEEMFFLQGYTTNMIIDLVNQSHSIPALAEALAPYEYGISIAKKMDRAQKTGRDPMEVLGLHRMARKPLSARLAPAV